MEPDRKTIIILEDDEDLLSLYQDSGFQDRLKTKGLDFDLVLVKTVDELRAKVREGVRVACLVTDMRGVGWEGGIDHILSFRGEEQLDAPVIITTGSSVEWTDDSQNEGVLRDVGIHILNKPFRISKFIEKIHEALQNT